jgi:hypothetical protein
MIRKPLPAVYVSESAVIIAPSSNSPFITVATLPLFGLTLFPCVTAAASNEPEVATPEYSKIANRMVAEALSDTVTVFAPPTIFSA